MQLLMVKLTAKPGQGDALLAIVSKFMMRGPVAHGLVRYSMGRDEDAPEEFILSEEWPSTQALEAFLNTPMFHEFAGTMLPLLMRPPESLLYRIVASIGDTSHPAKAD